MKKGLFGFWFGFYENEFNFDFFQFSFDSLMEDQIEKY